MTEPRDIEHSQPPEVVGNDLVFLYRGINRTHDSKRAGGWWSTNPYYSLVRVGNGSMFVAIVDKSELKQHATDVSIEADYENYLFPDQDPSTARMVTPEELEALRKKATFSKGAIGGTMMKPPDNPIEAGREIFSPHDRE